MQGKRRAKPRRWSVVVLLPLAVVAPLAAAQQTGADAFGDDEFALIEAGNRKGEDDPALEECTATTAPVLTAAPRVLDFGEVAVSLSTDSLLTLTNTSDTPFSGNAATAGAFSLADNVVEIAAGVSIDLPVTFTPDARGPFESLLQISVDDVCVLDVPLSGTGVGPVLQADPAMVDFGVVRAGDTRSRRIRVANAGELMLDGKATVPLPFAIGGDSNYDLAEGATRMLTVDFAPGELGASEAQLDLTGGGGASVVLRGTAAEEVGQVRGQIVDSGSGQPLTCAAVAFESDGGFSSTSTADANGVFLTETLPLGVYEVRMFAPGYASQSFSLVLDRGLVERPFALASHSASGTVRGVVGDAVNGALLGGVKVRVFQDQAEIATVYTCTKGAYEVRVPNPDAPLGFVMEAPGYDTDSLTQLFDPPFDGPINFVLLPSAVSDASIEGTVTSQPSDTPLSMATITATNLGIARTVFSRAGGLFDLPQLASGEYTLRVSAPEHLAQDDLLAAAFDGEEAQPMEIALIQGEDSVDPMDNGGDGDSGGCSVSAYARWPHCSVHDRRSALLDNMALLLILLIFGFSGSALRPSRRRDRKSL